MKNPLIISKLNCILSQLLVNKTTNKQTSQMTILLELANGEVDF